MFLSQQTTYVWRINATKHLTVYVHQCALSPATVSTRVVFEENLDQDQHHFHLAPCYLFNRQQEIQQRLWNLHPSNVMTMTDRWWRVKNPWYLCMWCEWSKVLSTVERNTAWNILPPHIRIWIRHVFCPSGRVLTESQHVPCSDWMNLIFLKSYQSLRKDEHCYYDCSFWWTLDEKKQFGTSPL